jgi:hypothetical protein
MPWVFRAVRAFVVLNVSFRVDHEEETARKQAVQYARKRQTPSIGRGSNEGVWRDVCAERLKHDEKAEERRTVLTNTGIL